MSYWCNVWRITVLNLKRVGLAHLWSVALILYFLILSAGLPKYFHAGEKEQIFWTNYALDVIFLTLIGIMGCTFSKDYLGRYWRRRSISRKLCILKSLPISVREIVAARILHFVLMHLIMGALFFAGFYLISSDIRAELSAAEYLEFVGLWLGYGLLAGSNYLFWELGLREFTYFKLNLVSALLYIALPILLRAFGIQIVWGSVRLIHTFGPLCPLVSLGAGIAALLICLRQSEKRLAERDLA